MVFALCSDEADGVSPAEKLSPQDLHRLRNAFTAILDSRGGGRTRPKSGMNLKEFHQALGSVIGPHIDETWVERFFDEVRRTEAQTETWVTLDGWCGANVSTFMHSWITAVLDR